MSAFRKEERLDKKKSYRSNVILSRHSLGNGHDVSLGCCKLIVHWPGTLQPPNSSAQPTKKHSHVGTLCLSLLSTVSQPQPVRLCCYHEHHITIAHTHLIRGRRQPILPFFGFVFFCISFHDHHYSKPENDRPNNGQEPPGQAQRAETKQCGGTGQQQQHANQVNIYQHPQQKAYTAWIDAHTNALLIAHCH